MIQVNRAIGEIYGFSLDPFHQQIKCQRHHNLSAFIPIVVPYCRWRDKNMETPETIYMNQLERFWDTLRQKLGPQDMARVEEMLAGEDNLRKKALLSLLDYLFMKWFIYGEKEIGDYDIGFIREIITIRRRVTPHDLDIIGGGK